MTASTDEPTAMRDVAGPRVVVTVYLAVLGVAAVMGILLGVVDPDGLDPELFFVVDLPPTPLGMAVFGVTTVGSVLGVLLLVVHYVSQFDDAKAE